MQTVEEFEYNIRIRPLSIKQIIYTNPGTNFFFFLDGFGFEQFSISDGSGFSPFCLKNPNPTLLFQPGQNANCMEFSVKCSGRLATSATFCDRSFGLLGKQTFILLVLRFSPFIFLRFALPSWLITSLGQRDTEGHASLDLEKELARTRELKFCPSHTRTGSVSPFLDPCYN